MASDDVIKQKVNMFNKIYGTYIDVNSAENTVANYDKLASEYEQDFVGLGYKTPNTVAAEAIKHLQSKDAEVLDLACGTGLVGESLKSCGFTGVIEGVDGSSSMLEQARKREIYRNLLCAFVVPDKPLPYSDDQFDAIVCSGGFGPGHLNPSVLHNLIKILKQNGVIVLATRENKQADSYVEDFKSVLENLKQQNLIKLENSFSTTYFDFDAATMTENKSNPVQACIYTIKKI